MRSELPQNDIVLLGVGHTNSHVLKMWRMNPITNARLTCISNFGVATYSGMLPGTLAGQYTPDEMQIDLVRLCAAAGARLIQDEVTGLDVANQRLLFAERPPLPFDALSIGVGSQPAEVPGEDIHVLRIKPMQSFLRRLDTRLDLLAQHVTDRPWRIAIVGGGAGGFEIACCLPRHIKQRYPAANSTLTLVDRSDDILKSMPSRTRALARQELKRLNIELDLGRQIVNVNGDGNLQFPDGSELEADLVLWATSARAPEILSQFDLPKDDRGFLLIRDTLQSTANDAIFAVGDAGTLDQQPTAKAGVYAVRQGPVLWENLQRQIAGHSLNSWQPQRSFLTLLSTGDDRAILTYKGMSVHAGWCWKFKDWIDRRFMKMYQNYEPRMAMPAPPATTKAKMYCGGCGSKVPAGMLSRVLKQLDNPTSHRVLLGLNQPDDVAVVATPEQQVAVTTDFFTTFLDDPWLLGQVAAQNALSDLYASGSVPQAALAMVTIPHGPAQQQEQFLLELLSGALQVLRPARVPIVGGHTIEGEQPTIGFTLLGDLGEQQLASKDRLRAGDLLILTKPLGTGILLAAHQQAMCSADSMNALLQSMLASNQQAASVALDLGCRAMTDVTGFGLAGHLYEMLKASQLSASLSLTSLPLLPGVVELASDGIESSLAPGNREVERNFVATQTSHQNDARYAALFDPQTSGGLLLGVSPDLIPELQEQLGNSAIVIGKVIETANTDPQIHISS